MSAGQWNDVQQVGTPAEGIAAVVAAVREADTADDQALEATSLQTLTARLAPHSPGGEVEGTVIVRPLGRLEAGHLTTERQIVALRHRAGPVVGDGALGAQLPTRHTGLFCRA